MTNQATLEPTKQDALLDAAERLLVEVGYAGITTRRLAAEAGINQGLVHYYFGSMENVLVSVLERFTARLIARQRAMYAADAPFIDKWRQAMRYLDEDFENGYQKIWCELQALAWNRPDLRERIAQQTREWRTVLRAAFEQGRQEHDIDMPLDPLDPLVAIVETFNQGIILERLSGIESGHRELLDWIDEWLAASRR